MAVQAACQGGSFAVESVAAFAWNGWQASSGISGNLGLEYAFRPQKLMIDLVAEGDLGLQKGLSLKWGSNEKPSKTPRIVRFSLQGAANFSRSAFLGR
jgi:hypothetical protein